MVHVLVSVILIIVVLMQSQQSMNISGMFGGASQSAMGNKPQSVLSRATVILGITFMLVSVMLAMWPSEETSTLDAGTQQAPVTQQQNNQPSPQPASGGNNQSNAPADQGEAQGPATAPAPERES